jgi:hypothetical protein
MISTLFGKKKISEDRLANVVVNSIVRSVEQGFPLIAAEFNEAPEFVQSPEIHELEDKPFANVVMAGNLIEIAPHLSAGQDRRLINLAIAKFAKTQGEPTIEMEERIRSTQSLIKRVNSPSKVTLYGMSKALFHQYDLYQFQEDYFKDLKAPNPILLKRLNALMEHFLFGGEELCDQFRITSR